MEPSLTRIIVHARAMVNGGAHKTCQVLIYSSTIFISSTLNPYIIPEASLHRTTFVAVQVSGVGQLIHQFINPLICGLDLPLQPFLFMQTLRGGEALVQRQHVLHNKLNIHALLGGPLPILNAISAKVSCSFAKGLVLRLTLLLKAWFRVALEMRLWRLVCREYDYEIFYDLTEMSSMRR